MKHLVIGGGEIGTAISDVLGCEVHDPFQNKNIVGVYDVIHICFPFSDRFYKYVKEYKALFNNKYTVIHATVPLGVSDSLNAIHSPVRGVHPHLKESITTFTKYFGGRNSQEIVKEMETYGIKGIALDDAMTCELMKLVDTSNYGINILIEKEIHRLCIKYKVPFEYVYSHANSTYNEGYLAMNMPQFQKYNLKHMEGKIGGHCVCENSLLLDSWLNDIISKQNI